MLCMIFKGHGVHLGTSLSYQAEMKRQEKAGRRRGANHQMTLWRWSRGTLTALTRRTLSCVQLTCVPLLRGESISGLDSILIYIELLLVVFNSRSLLLSWKQPSIIHRAQADVAMLQEVIPSTLNIIKNKLGSEFHVLHSGRMSHLHH